MSAPWEPHKRRGPIAAEYSSPGPCYGLPGLIGQPGHDTRSVHYRGPAYHFGVKRVKFSDEASPGPKHKPNLNIYKDGKDGTPHYSLSSRNKQLKSFVVPGAGTYKPEAVGQQAHLRHPAYSFGTRPRQRRSDKVPAPNSYTLPTVLAKTYQSDKTEAPCYTLVGRKEIGGFHEDLKKAPGPGEYNTTEPNTFKDKSPVYSIQSRNVMPGDSTQKPGPGAHTPCEPHKVKYAAPQYSFGIRHTQYEAPLIVEVVEDRVDGRLQLPPISTHMTQN